MDWIEEIYGPVNHNSRKCKVCRQAYKLFMSAAQRISGLTFSELLLYLKNGYKFDRKMLKAETIEEVEDKRDEFWERHREHLDEYFDRSELYTKSVDDIRAESELEKVKDQLKQTSIDPDMVITSRHGYLDAVVDAYCALAREIEKFINGHQ